MRNRTTPIVFTAVLLTLLLTLSGCGGDRAPNPVPTLSALSTESVLLGSPDLTLSITGAQFVAETVVQFGATPLTPSQVTAGSISVVVPKTLLTTAGVVKVTVSNPTPGGGMSNSLNFTVGYPVPTITSFVASSTLVNSTGFTLEMDGHGFTAGTRVRFGTDELTPTSFTDSHLVALVPDALLTTARVVSVTTTNPTPLGGTSNALEFSVNNPVPAITALSITTVEAGATADLALSVTGTNFVSGATVSFGPHTLSPAAPGSEKLDVAVPATALALGAAFSVTVTNPGPGGGVSNAVAFQVNNPVPQLTALSQLEVTAGSSTLELMLIGSKFVSTSTVDFGGTVLTPASVTKEEMVISVPESAMATGNVIQVRAISPEPGGGASSAINFTVNNPLPVISAATPTSITNTGSDAVITLVGSNFVSSSAVMAGANGVTSSQLSRTQLQVTLPAAMVSTAVADGYLPITVSNPSPAGGVSNTFNLIVHQKAPFEWHTVANGSTALPGGKESTLFLTFGEASVNSSGLAVFKGQSTASTSQTGDTSSTTGIFSADLNTGTLATIADITMLVPDPNNVTYGTTFAKFGGFPSLARIDAGSALVGFAATHPPVMQLQSGGRVGSSGLYANPSNALDTAVGLFTQDPYTFFQVPDMAAGTAFGAVPVSPAVVNGSTVVFKGDYLNGTTVAMGIYYRDLVADSGNSPVALIASTYSTKMPGKSIKFGYMGAPSAVGSTAVFVGYDKKDAPTAGGIYSATVATSSTLTPLVTIGTAVPGESSTDTFTRFADAVSFDGRYVGFWGAWGTEATPLHVTCSTEGDAALNAYCLTLFPDGYDVQVPMHQGMFVYDTTTSTLSAVAKTGAEFSDFTYWVFVGTVPESGSPTGGPPSGGEEAEPALETPGFVLSPNIAVAGQGASAYQVAFKAKTGSVDGIYTTSGPDAAAIQTLLDTTMAGNAVDGAADPNSMIKTLVLEREGMRGQWLTVGSTLLDSTGQVRSSGVYATSVAAN